MKRRRLEAEKNHSEDIDSNKQPKQGSYWALVAAFFLLISIFMFLRSPFFLVRHYSITGANKVSKDEIIARCTQKSANIFDLDLDKIRNTLTSSPWIKDVRCTRKLPDTIVISVEERRPVVFAPIDQKMWLIDEEGRVLQEDDGVFTDLIAFTGLKGVLAPGQFIEPQYIQGLKTAMRLGPTSKEKTIEINIENGKCMLVLDDGCKVFLDDQETELESRLSLLESILIELDEGDKRAEYIDLRFDKHAVKLRM